MAALSGVQIVLDNDRAMMSNINRQVVATQDKQRPLASAFSLNWQRVATTESRDQGLFAFQTRNTAQASYSRSGVFLKRDDAKPHRKRVEAYSAAMTPAQGVCVGQSRACQFWRLQRVPLMTDVKRPAPRFIWVWVSFARRTLEARYLRNTKC